MKAEGFMKKDVVTIGPEERLHKILRVMRNNSVKQVIIEKEGKYEGLVSLSGLIRHGFGIANGKAKNFKVRNIPLIKKDDDEHEVARKLIASGIKALPVIEKGEVLGVVGEEELIDFVDYSKKENLSNECITAAKDDAVSTVENLMTNNNISRIPIANKKGDIVGIINDLDLVAVFEGDKEMEGGPQKSTGQGQESYKEKLRRGETNAEAIMKGTNTFPAGLEFEKIKEEVKEKGYIIILANDKKEIITERDFVERLSIVPKEGVYVQITNLQEENSFVKKKIDDAITKFLQKIGKRLEGLESFFMHVKRHEKSGKKVKYSIRTRFQTPIGLFTSNAWDWDLVTATQKALNKVEKEITKEIDKMKKRPKKAKGK